MVSIAHPQKTGKRGPGTWAALILLGILACCGDALAKKARPVSKAVFPATGPRTLTILAPVDLATGRIDPESGDMLRRTLAQNPHWRVGTGDSTARNLREYGLDPDRPCMEFQCAFDAGNALQTEFVLFGTTTSLPGLHAYTLDLVHIPTAQVIWSRVGQAPERAGEARKPNRQGYILEGTLQFAVSDLDPGRLDLRKRPSMGLLGVMDAGPSTSYSRIVLHRALSHAYASRAYDLLGPAELGELMTALDIGQGRNGLPTAAGGGLAPRDEAPRGTGFGADGGLGGSGNAPGGEDMLSLGTKMGVRYLLWTRVDSQGGDHKAELTLYDVAGRKLIRHWPTRESSDFASLLGLEDRFLTALGNGAPLSMGGKEAPGHGLRIFGKAASTTVALAAGAAMGYLAYRNKQDADLEYRRFHSARSGQEAAQARQNVMRQDTEARHYGVLGGISLALGVAVWVF